jgi:dsDNA-specific endonuclease/ATPase MutS2
MSAIERGFYVAVGAADLAAEKVQELPVVKQVIERTSELRRKSIIDQAREIEPRLRKQAKELQERGEKVVKRVRQEAKDLQKQVRELPTSARKQAETLRTDARKQVSEIRDRLQKAVGRGNGRAKPAPKTKVSAAARSAAAEIS